MDVFEDTRHDIYSKASPCPNAIDDHWMFNIDLEQVNLNLINTAERGSNYCPLEKRVKINFTEEACDRGGVLKFQKCS